MVEENNTEGIMEKKNSIFSSSEKNCFRKKTKIKNSLPIRIMSGETESSSEMQI